MMKGTQIIWLCVLFGMYGAAVGCSESRAPDLYLDVSRADTIRIPIDSETPHSNDDQHLDFIDGQAVLVLLNKRNRTCYQFQFPEGRLMRKIYLPAEWAEACGPLANAGCIADMQGLWIFSHDLERLFRYDNQGRLIKKIDLKHLVKFREDVNLPWVLDGYPILNMGGRLLMSGSAGHVVDFTKTATVLSYYNDSCTFFAPYPTNYEAGNFGFTHLYHPSIDIVHDSLLAISFPLSDLVYLWNPATSKVVDSIDLGSIYFDASQTVPFAPRSKDRVTIQNKKQVEEYDFTTAHYLKVHYDRASRKLIRIANAIPNTPAIIKENGGHIWMGIGYSVMIANADGSGKSEYLLPRDMYDVMKTLVYNGKLYLLPLPKHQDDEDAMTYHVVDL